MEDREAPDRETKEEFHRLSSRLMEERWAFYPTSAARFGLHQYDGMLPDLSRDAVRRRLRDINDGLEELGKTDSQALAAQERLDYMLLDLALQKERFDLAELRSLETDPMHHLRYLNVTGYVQRDYAPLPDRVRSATRVLDQAPDFLNTALGRLEDELGLPVLDMSIDGYEGMAQFYRADLGKVSEGLQDSDIAKEFDRAREKAAQEIDRFVAALRDRRQRASPDFAIGAELYGKMLRYGEMVDLPLSRIEAVGQADIERNLHQLAEVAARIDPRKSIGELIEEFSKNHSTAEALIPDAARLLDDIRGFIVDRGILTLPSEEGCEVRETPSFSRWSFASMDTPGALERVATESYYYITPVEPHWTEEQKEQWLSNFNYNTIQIVSIHEVYPGHFAHYLHSRSAPSVVNKALRAYSTSEGWAHYTEEMMLDEGYGEGDLSLRLSQICEALLRDCRYLCSIWMHTQGMDVDEATRFFVNKSYMGEFPARKEALRGTFDPGYLNYTLGKLLILKLREDYRREQGTSFSLKQFHDSLLSFGGPPVPLLREMLLQDPYKPAL